MLPKGGRERKERKERGKREKIGREGGRLNGARIQNRHILNSKEEKMIEEKKKSIMVKKEILGRERNSSFKVGGRE